MESLHQFNDASDKRLMEQRPNGAAGHVRWVICAMLFFATTKNYMDRTASDMFPVNAVATVIGIGTLAGAAGGVLMAIAAGNILQWTGRYAPPFLYAGFAYLVALGVILLLAPGLQRATLSI